jgi:hypothetical protein
MRMSSQESHVPFAFSRSPRGRQRRNRIAGFTLAFLTFLEALLPLTQTHASVCSLPGLVCPRQTSWSALTARTLHTQGALAPARASD